MPSCNGLTVQFICGSVHIRLVLICKQELIGDDDGHDRVGSDHGDEDDTLRFFILVDGNVGVASLFHDIEARFDDFPAMLSDTSIGSCHRIHLNLE